MVLRNFGRGRPLNAPPATSMAAQSSMLKSSSWTQMVGRISMPWSENLEQDTKSESAGGDASARWNVLNYLRAAPVRAVPLLRDELGPSKERVSVRGPARKH